MTLRHYNSCQVSGSQEAHAQCSSLKRSEYLRDERRKRGPKGKGGRVELGSVTFQNKDRGVGLVGSTLQRQTGEQGLTSLVSI